MLAKQLCHRVKASPLDKTKQMLKKWISLKKKGTSAVNDQRRS
jgi:hypothetical protein